MCKKYMSFCIIYSIATYRYIVTTFIFKFANETDGSMSFLFTNKLNNVLVKLLKPYRNIKSILLHL